MNVTVGSEAAWAPIGAVKTASGYDVAWKITGADVYTVWAVDPNGHYISDLIGGSSGSSGALEAFEPIFGQDLNGDKVIGVPAANTLTVGAGQTLEVTGAYSGGIVFASASGTLKLDSSASFTGSIVTQLAIGDVIDLVDITAGAGAKLSYSGNAGPGTLTVSDGTHTAHIVLPGSYSLGNFTPTSDGHNGTTVVDPPIASVALVPRAILPTVPIETRAQLATMSTGAEAGYATAAPVAAAAVEPLTVGSFSGLAPSVPLASPVILLSSQNALSDTGMSGGGAPVARVRPYDDGELQADDTRYAGLPAAIAPPDAAIAREIVSADDLILAIQKGNIALKIDAPAGSAPQSSPWLFDDERGVLEAPRPEPLTIVIDGDDDGLAQAGGFNPVQPSAGQAVVVPDQSWFGAMRTAWMQPIRGWWWR
jgi:hypothetical protein